MASKIPWTEETWNPVVGCTKCSSGCLNCYAEKMAYRLACMGHQKYRDVVDWVRTSTKRFWWNEKVFCDNSILDKPLHWRKPRKIFVCSMSDLFHPKVPFEFIHKVWGVMKGCPQHIFQILTKRPERMLKDVGMIYKLERLGWARGFWQHLHLGVTVCTQASADEKIPILLQIPAAVRFISIEPMLEGIEIMRYLPDQLARAIGSAVGFEIKGGIEWVIVGAESGPARRECKIEWVESIVDQCKVAGVPCFVKQIHKDGKLVKMPAEFPQDSPK